MSNQSKLPDDPKLQARMARLEKHDYRVEHIFRRILHNIERAIAGITLIILVAALVMELYICLTNWEYIADISHYLHNVLTIVVGLEFV